MRYLTIVGFQSRILHSDVQCPAFAREEETLSQARCHPALLHFDDILKTPSYYVLNALYQGGTLRYRKEHVGYAKTAVQMHGYMFTLYARDRQRPAIVSQPRTISVELM